MKPPPVFGVDYSLLCASVSVSSGSIHHAIHLRSFAYIFGRYSSQFYSIHQTLWLVCRCLHSIGIIDFGPSIFSLRPKFGDIYNFIDATAHWLIACLLAFNENTWISTSIQSESFHFASTPIACSINYQHSSDWLTRTNLFYLLSWIHRNRFRFTCEPLEVSLV